PGSEIVPSSAPRFCSLLSIRFGDAVSLLVARSWTQLRQRPSCATHGCIFLSTKKNVPLLFRKAVPHPEQASSMSSSAFQAQSRNSSICPLGSKLAQLPRSEEYFIHSRRIFI